MVGNLFINSVGKAKYMCLIPPSSPPPWHSRTVVLETNFFTLAYILYDQAYKFIYTCQLRTLCIILFYIRTFVLWILGLIWMRNTHWFVSIDGTPAPETKRRRIRRFRRLDVAVSYIQEMGVLLIEWSWIAVLKRKGKCIIACEVSECSALKITTSQWTMSSQPHQLPDYFDQSSSWLSNK